MATVTICSDFGALKKKVSHCFPIYLPWSDGTRCHDLSFLNVELEDNFFTLLFHFHQEALQFFFTFCHKGAVICVPGYWYFSRQSWFQLVLPPAQRFSWCTLHINKQGDNIQPWHTPFPIWNQSVVPHSVLTVASWPSHRFLKRQVKWSGIPISFRIFQFIVIHTVVGFGIVNKAEIDVFLELSGFFDEPVDVGNLISGSSAFSKTSLNIWKFSVRVLLKPGLENFEHYFASVWDKCNCAAVLALFGIAFLWDWNEYCLKYAIQCC